MGGYTTNYGTVQGKNLLTVSLNNTESKRLQYAASFAIDALKQDLRSAHSRPHRSIQYWPATVIIHLHPHPNPLLGITLCERPPSSS